MDGKWTSKMDKNEFDRLNEVLWSKADRKDQKQFHLFIYHLLDSAAVALRLWEVSLPDAIKNEISALLKLDCATAGKLIAYWTALHDIGKASPVFQEMLLEQSKKAQKAGFVFPTHLDPKIFHSRVSARFLREGNLVPCQVDIAISGHHGSWNCDYEFSNPSYGEAKWQDFRKAVQEELIFILGITDEIRQDIEDVEESNVFTSWFSGFISVADWIASNEDYFHYHSKLEALAKYFHNALDQADMTLNKLGWVGWKSRGEMVSFKTMYPCLSPRPIQSKIFELYDQFDPQEPFILVVEAPTGIGKTEIAFYLADRWIQQSGGSGIYIAMPTQATSNQIYERSIQILKDRYPDDLLSIVLAHGQAAWNEKVNDIRLKEIGEDQEHAVVAAEWFQNNRKRALLTPFGVGTVDQVFLSILQTRHFFVRLFGLKNKVIIFDEVHAYDSYMQELFGRLLQWLHSLGAAVIVLSATLPEAFRQQIISSYCGKESVIADNQEYPRLSIASPDKGVKTYGLQQEIPDDQERRLSLQWRDEADLVTLLRERLQDGGCAAIICNTVVKAQELYGVLADKKLVEKENLILFHARFPQSWRQTKEKDVLKKFSKDSNGRTRSQGEDMNPARPFRAIVIATQVIEQSLDLDFDWMVSEVAPVDLILQRAGRLHRHKRVRPARLQTPQFVLLKPAVIQEGQLPDFGRSKKVYPPSVLLKSYLVLKSAGETLETIHQTRHLIELVYGKIPDAFADSGWAQDLETMVQNETEKARLTRSKARAAMIAQPDEEEFLYSTNVELRDDEDPKVHRFYQALTRDTDGLNLSLICLHRCGEGLYVDPECKGQPVRWEGLENNYAMLKEMLSQSLSISRSDVINHLLGCDQLIQVKTIPALRRYRIMPFLDGCFETDRFRFELTPELGLIISGKK
jgi:CRISPR-associated endonuclease/helicase Cas3